MNRYASSRTSQLEQLEAIVNPFEEVLLACALARTDERGRFTARAVGDALMLMGIKLSMTSFGRNLEQFCDIRRGPTLSREDLPNNYQYYFDYLLLKPITVVKAPSEGIMRQEHLD